jgi:hypothetical protein
MILTGFFTSCILVRDGNFTHQDNVSIDTSKIRLDGYYYHTLPPANKTKGTRISPLVLWKDGTAAQVYFVQGKRLDSEKPHTTVYGTLEEATAKFEDNIDSLLTGSREDPAWWGGFRLRNDTLRFQVMSYGFSRIPLFFEYSPSKFSARVINDTTFVVFRTNPLSYQDPREVHKVYHFSPLPDSAKPDSKNWTNDLR